MREQARRRGSSLITGLTALTAGTLLVGGAFALGGGEPVEPVDDAPDSLSTVPVPLGDFSAFVEDELAVKELGKLLFHEMAAGSDGVQACASCHFHAGADNRIVNQVHPGPDGSFDAAPVNGILNADAFPFTKLEDPQDNDSAIVSQTDDRSSSQGVHAATFLGVTPGNDVDDLDPLDDPDGFDIDLLNVRRVEPRNTPTVINTVFVDRLFWDGRADNRFNGVSPLGVRCGETVLHLDGPDPGDPVSNVVVDVHDAALASQATGPPLSDREMGSFGRDFPNLGKKLLALEPLAGQIVHPEDSLLGAYANSPDGVAGPAGITHPSGATYADLVMAAFKPEWWASNQDFGGFSQMEMNFSLFWGISIACYESLLVSGETRYDLWADAGKPSDGGGILTEQEMEGLDIFLNDGGCISCHEGPEFGGAMISSFSDSSHTGEMETLIERMLMHDGKTSGDIHFETGDDPDDMNFDPRGKIIEVRPPGFVGPPLAWGVLEGNFSGAGTCGEADVENLMNHGSGAPSTTGFGSFEAIMTFTNDDECNMSFSVSLEWTWPGLPAGDYEVVVGGLNVGSIEMGEVGPPALYDSGFYNIGVRPTAEDLGAGGEGPCGPFSMTRRELDGSEDVDDGLDPPASSSERTAVDGAFRTMSIRNIELTGPYMHNGGFSTLEQVVDFYAGGGHFIDVNSEADPDVDGFEISESGKAALVAFMLTLTDERVRFRQGPFDGPQLLVPNGSVEPVVDDGDGNAVDDLFIEIAATGANGALDPIEPFHTQLAPAITVSGGEGGLTLNESGVADSATISVVLAKPPTEDVVVDLTPTTSGQVSLSSTSLVFTTENWFTAQEVEVAAIEDMQIDGDAQLNLVTAVSSYDAEWDALDVEDVLVTAVDSGRVWTTLTIEAESGSLTAPMQALPNPRSSGGTMIRTLDGVGDAAAGAGGELAIDFTLPVTTETGPYVVWMLTSAPDRNGDSFWFSMDDSAWRQWTAFNHPRSTWAWDRVQMSSTNDSSAFLFDVQPGDHTLRIQHREDGGSIDLIVITNDLDFVPRGAPADLPVEIEEAPIEVGFNR